MHRLKFAIIGCGRIAHRHAEHICEIGELKCVCDINKNRADEFSKKYSTSCYYSIEDLLEHETTLDVVSICTPNYLHAEQSIKALKAGFHVLCEKPMAISVDDCRNMILQMEKCGKLLFIIKQNRFNPPIVAVKRAIDEGRFGKILSVQLNCFWNRNNDYYTSSEWKGRKLYDGGTLFTQFSHFIDLLYWMIGDVKRVFALSGNLSHKNIIEFEDTGVVAFEFFNGALGSIHYTVNSFSCNMEGSITIFGEKGTVKVGGQYLNELEYQKFEDHEIVDLPVGNPPNNYGNYIGSMSNHRNVYENVHDVLNRNGVIATNSIDGMKTVEIIEKIYNAMEEIHNK